MTQFDLTTYQALSFDIYATLIDWESGIFTQLAPLLSRIPPTSPLWKKTLEEAKVHLLHRYAENEYILEHEQPELKYSLLLAGIYERIATELQVDAARDEALTFGQGIGQWAPFPDTVAAMQSLGKRYKLIALSNVDRASFDRTLAGPLRGVRFDAIYTAEAIGSYKPDPNNFRYLVEHVESDFGIGKDGILHTAQSLNHDHVPVKELGFRPSVWISRGGGSMGWGDLDSLEGKLNLGATFETLGDMAEAVEKAFHGRSQAAGLEGVERR